MKEYRKERRDHTREYHEYAPHKTEDSGPREPREPLPGALARVRVELKRKYNDPEKNFKEMLQEFKRRVSNAGILHDYKEHQFYESKTEKRRKARRAAQKKLLMESIERKIIAGEKDINASAGMIKKVLANMAEKKEKKEKKEKRKQSYNKHHGEGHQDD